MKAFAFGFLMVLVPLLIVGVLVTVIDEPYRLDPIKRGLRRIGRSFVNWFGV